MSAPRIVLASTSRYRAELLARVLDRFDQVAPGVDESPQPDEAPAERAARLALAKALSVSDNRREALVIGSDQVAALSGRVLRKPGNIENAHKQLLASSGKTVDFFTGLCVIDGHDGRRQTHLDRTRVFFRELSDPEIERYLAREHPLDCAGSFKSEGAGIALFERIESEDPTALIGLPLIAVTRLLREAGIALF